MDLVTISCNIYYISLIYLPSPKTKGLIIYLAFNVMTTDTILKNINPLSLLENLYSVIIRKSHHNNIN
jgi:hypothetical protein